MKKDNEQDLAITKDAGETQPQAGGPKNGAYDATKIQVLEGIDAVRLRPAMYLGDTVSRGLHHLVY